MPSQNSTLNQHQILAHEIKSAKKLMFKRHREGLPLRSALDQFAVDIRHRFEKIAPATTGQLSSEPYPRSSVPSLAHAISRIVKSPIAPERLQREVSNFVMDTSGSLLDDSPEMIEKALGFGMCGYAGCSGSGDPLNPCSGPDCPSHTQSGEGKGQSALTDEIEKTETPTKSDTRGYQMLTKAERDYICQELGRQLGDTYHARMLFLLLNHFVAVGCFGGVPKQEGEIMDVKEEVFKNSSDALHDALGQLAEEGLPALRRDLACQAGNCAHDDPTNHGGEVIPDAAEPESQASPESPTSSPDPERDPRPYKKSIEIVFYTEPAAEALFKLLSYVATRGDDPSGNAKVDDILDIVWAKTETSYNLRQDATAAIAREFAEPEQLIRNQPLT